MKYLKIKSVLSRPFINYPDEYLNMRIERCEADMDTFNEKAYELLILERAYRN